VPHKYLLIKLQHLLDFLVSSKGNMYFSQRYGSATEVQSHRAASCLLVPAWVALALKEIGAGEVLWLRFVILPSHFLFFCPLLRSCSGTGDQDIADQIKDLSLAREHGHVEENSRRCPGQLKTDVGRIPDQQREEEFPQSI